jgi:hypothetical protein
MKVAYASGSKNAMSWCDNLELLTPVQVS